MTAKFPANVTDSQAAQHHCLLCVDLEMAVAYWNLVLSGRFKFLDLWNRFLLVSQRSKTGHEQLKCDGSVATLILKSGPQDATLLIS